MALASDRPRFRCKENVTERIASIGHEIADLGTALHNNSDSLRLVADE